MGQLEQSDKEYLFAVFLSHNISADDPRRKSRGIFHYPCPFCGEPVDCWRSAEAGKIVATCFECNLVAEG